VNLAESLRIAVRALFANKVRSVLTMLGVIIGVSAVILLVAIGTGVQGEVTSTVEGLGSNLLFIFPGKQDTSGRGGGFGPGMSGGKPFSVQDAQYLAQRLQLIDAVVPVASGAGTAKFLSRSDYATLSGTNDQGTLVDSAKIGGGRYFNRSENDAAARVAIIGYTVKSQLFPNGENPIGQVITINGQRFNVIGWYEKVGGSLSGDQDNVIRMPITTMQSLTGNNRVPIMLVKVTKTSDIDLVRAQIKRVLAPKFDDQITVMSQDQTLGIFNQLLGTLTIMLAGIAGISLLVGGIGIMNIMLVSVTERTREIGIRKAVGARTYDILSQFVIEAMMLSVMGGALGITVGWIGATALSPFVPTEITGWAVTLAFCFSAGVGVFFGVYPAWKASQLDPIVALRYE
jgi:putative ABC transport system permease protein